MIQLNLKYLSPYSVKRTTVGKNDVFPSKKVWQYSIRKADRRKTSFSSYVRKDDLSKMLNGVKGGSYGKRRFP